MRRWIFGGAALLLAGCDAGATQAEASVAPVILGGEVVTPSATTGGDEPTAPSAGEGEVAQAQSQPAAGTTGDRRPGPLAPGQVGHFGAPFTISTAPISLSDALATCVGTGQACLVSATVSRVCQVSGCWFTVDAPGVDSTVRIRMFDYGFFVPRNAIGAQAVFEGTLTSEEVSQEQAQHYADDEAAAGGTRRVVAGPEHAFEFMITGVSLTMPSPG